jgi:hypothetical protein
MLSSKVSRAAVGLATTSRRRRFFRCSDSYSYASILQSASHTFDQTLGFREPGEIKAAGGDCRQACCVEDLQFSSGAGHRGRNLGTERSGWPAPSFDWRRTVEPCFMSKRVVSIGEHSSTIADLDVYSPEEQNYAKMPVRRHSPQLEVLQGSGLSLSNFIPSCYAAVLTLPVTKNSMPTQFPAYAKDTMYQLATARCQYRQQRVS